MLDRIRTLLASPPRPRDPSPGAGQSDEDDDRFPVFQTAWKDGATFEDMFGSNPFQLHGAVGGSGADNHRPDVAKVETFLGDAGFYKPMTKDGPTGWHNTNLDVAIKAFQKTHGLKVDGLLKPNGPTITKIGALLGGNVNPTTPGVMPVPGDPDYRPPVGETPPTSRPAPGTTRKVEPLGEPDYSKRQPHRPPATGEWPWTIGKAPIIHEDPWPPKSGVLPKPLDPRAEARRWVEWFDRNPRRPAPARTPEMRDPFPGHGIDEDGAAQHDRYAQALVNDSDPSKTAAFLKNVIGWDGDKGRGDVADLLGRFQKVDPGKAKALQAELHKLTGERIPFRIAPMRANTGGPLADLADGGDPDAVQLPKANPWGSAEAADRWEAGNMAKVLLSRTDYKDAVKHFAGEFARDPDMAKPYTAAVFEEMAKSSPKQAVQFVRQMADGGLARLKDEEDEEEKPNEEPPARPDVPEGGAEKPEDKPEAKPEEGKEDQEAKGGDDKEEGKYPPPRDPDPCLGEQVDLEGAWQARDDAFVALRDRSAELENIQQRIEALRSGEAEPENAPEPPLPSPPARPSGGDKRGRGFLDFHSFKRGGGRPTGGKRDGKGGDGAGDVIDDGIETSLPWLDYRRKLAAARRAEIERLTAQAASLEAEIEELKAAVREAEDTITDRQGKLDACRASNPSSQ